MVTNIHTNMTLPYYMIGVLSDTGLYFHILACGMLTNTSRWKIQWSEGCLSCRTFGESLNGHKSFFSQY